MTETMLERMARAMIDSESFGAFCYLDSDSGSESVTVDGSVDFVALAKAALQAIREPSDGVLAAMDAAKDLWPSAHCDNQREMVRSRCIPKVHALIDSILNEEA